MIPLTSDRCDDFENPRNEDVESDEQIYADFSLDVTCTNDETLDVTSKHLVFKNESVRPVEEEVGTGGEDMPG